MSRGFSLVIVSGILVSLLVLYSSDLASAATPSPSLSPELQSIYGQAVTKFNGGDFEGARIRYQSVVDRAEVIGDETGIGAGLVGLASVNGALQEFSKAIELLSLALSHFRNTNDLGRESIALAMLGAIYFQEKDYSKAIEHLSYALDLATAFLQDATDEEKSFFLKTRPDQLSFKAQAHQRLGQWSEAMETYRQAGNDLKALGNPAEAALHLSLAGSIALEQQKLHLHSEKMKLQQQAVDLFAQAQSLYEEANNVEYTNQMRIYQSVSYLDAGSNLEVINILKPALAIAEQRKFYNQIGFAHYFIALAKNRQNDYTEALEHYQIAQRLIRDGTWNTKDPRIDGEILYSMGQILRLSGRYEEAIEDFREAVLKYREAKDLLGQAEVLSNLAEVFYWLPDVDLAIRYYSEALELYKTAGKVTKQVEVLTVLGETRVLSGRGSSEQNFALFTEARQLLQSMEKSTKIEAYSKLIEIWKSINEDEINKRAFDWVKNYPHLSQNDAQSLIFFKSSADRSWAIYDKWIEAAPTLGLEYLRAAGMLDQRLGKANLELGNLKNAESFLGSAYIIHTSMPLLREMEFEWAKDLYYLGEVYRQQGKFDQAIELFGKAALIGDIILHTSEVHWVFAGLGRAYTDKGEFDKATYHYKMGLEYLETVLSAQETEEFKIGAVEHAFRAYEGFPGLLLEQYKQTGDQRYLYEAFQYGEQLRTRAFLDLLTKSRATRQEGEVGVLAAKQEELRRQIASIHQQLRTTNFETSLEKASLAQLTQLRESWQDLQKIALGENTRHAEVVAPTIATIGDVQSALDEESLLLSYAPSKQGATLWAITKDTIQIYNLPARKEKGNILDDYLLTLREPLMTPIELSNHLAIGEELYRILLQPAEKLMREKRHLIIVPTGPLYYLPFEALIIPDPQVKESPPMTLANVHYLIKDFRVSYVPSPSVLVQQVKERARPKALRKFPLLAFGDPIYQAIQPGETDIHPERYAALRGFQLDPLKFSGEEVHRIAEIWEVPDDSPHINLRERATVKRVQELDLSQYRIVHFAMHAVLGDEVAWTTQPALVMSQVSPKDAGPSLLRFSDVLGLKLNADLVVLSACKTSLGRLREGEGIVGLTRAFLYAGAASAVVSLWSVEDQSTSLLMEIFYQRLKEGKNKAEALRQAKLDLLQEAVDLKAIGKNESLALPFYWAPFILVGDWE